MGDVTDRTDGEDAVKTVYVVDDDDHVRGGIDSLLRASGYVVRLFDSPDAFMRAPQADTPACLVLDIRLKGESGLDFQQRLRDEGGGLPVILITGHGDVPMTVRAMKAGAVDFLPKPFRDDDLLSAVAQAVKIDSGRRNQRSEAEDLAARYATLTTREKEVLGLVVAGLLNKQVADRLDLSIVTVKIHRGQAIRKMGATSLADLVRMAGILQIHDLRISRFNTRV